MNTIGFATDAAQQIVMRSDPMSEAVRELAHRAELLADYYRLCYEGCECDACMLSRNVYRAIAAVEAELNAKPFTVMSKGEADER
jgi:hypothetical protein